MKKCEVYEKVGIKFCDSNNLECSNCENPLEHYEKSIKSQQLRRDE